MEELKNELEKMGRDVVEGPSESTDAAAVPQQRRAPKRKAASAAAPTKASDLDMVAADMTVNQLQLALTAHHVVPPKGAKKAALVKMLDKARNDSVMGAGGLTGGLAASAASAAAADASSHSTRTSQRTPAAVAQKRKQKSGAAAASANKRKTGPARAAPARATAEESAAAVGQEQDEADPVLLAAEMAATALKDLAYSDLMNECEVRGLNPWQSKEEL